MNWRTRPRDAFGRLVVDPATLPRDERLAELRRCAGRLAADPDRGAQWVGGALLAYTHGRGELADLLGLRPPRGSTRTLAQIAQLADRDAALLALAAAIRNDRQALLVLRGDAPCPPQHRDLLEAAQAVGVPTGANAISRARRRHRQSSMMR